MNRIIAAVIFAVSLNAQQLIADEPNYAEKVVAIADEIQTRKVDFPQLADFVAAKAVDLKKLSISYGYHTHKPERRGGWTAGVPNPDDDGVWFYIDFHDSKSAAQIHTQPVLLPACLGKKKMSFLILEGKNSKRLTPILYAILKDNGVEFFRNSDHICE